MTEASEPVKIEVQDDVLIFLAQGDLGALNWTTDQQVLYRLLERVEDCSEPRVVIDMSGLTFADSTLLAVLVSLWRRVTARSGKMVLAAVPAEIGEVLHYTKLNSIWTSYPSRAEAIAALDK